MSFMLRPPGELWYLEHDPVAFLDQEAAATHCCHAFPQMPPSEAAAAAASQHDDDGASTGTAGINLSLKRPSDHVLDPFADGPEAPPASEQDADDGPPSGPGSTPPGGSGQPINRNRGRGGRGRGRPAAPKEKPKKKVFKPCAYCKNVTDDFSGNKKECRSCMKNVESAQRDAKANGELDLFKELQKDPEKMFHFLQAWEAEVGPPKGSGNARGGFKFAAYKQTYYTERSHKELSGIIMLTQKQFVDMLVQKGRDRAWAESEYQRRTQDEAYKKGIDPDSRLPTIQASSADREEQEVKRARQDEVGLVGREIKNPKRKATTSIAQTQLVIHGITSWI